MADRLLAIYYSDTSGIVYRSFEGGRWGKATPIAPGAHSNFTVSIDRNGTLYLFCQEANGDVHLYRLRQGEWKSRVMLKNPGNKQARLHIHPLLYDDGMSIIYNSVIGEGSALMLQSMDERGKWYPPERIDSYSQMGGTGIADARLGADFSVVPVAPDHALIFYARNAGEPAIGYVEASPTRTTTFNTIYSTGSKIIDTSFLVTNDSLHVLLVVRGMFSSQLIYRKKSSASFSAPVVIAEGAQISSCLLMFVSGILYAYFMVGGQAGFGQESSTQLAYSSSADVGETFSRAARYTNKFCAAPVKSTYISHVPMDEGGFFARQLYVDRNNVADVQLVPDMYEEFLPIIPVAVATTSALDEQTLGAPSGDTYVSEGLVDQVAVYKSKLELAQMQLEEKERRLVKHIQTEGEERKRLIARIRELEDELHELKTAGRAEEPSIQPGAADAARKYPLMILPDHTKTMI